MFPLREEGNQDWALLEVLHPAAQRCFDYPAIDMDLVDLGVREGCTLAGVENSQVILMCCPGPPGSALPTCSAVPALTSLRLQYYSFDKHLLSTYYKPGTEPGGGVCGDRETDIAPRELRSGREGDNRAITQADPLRPVGADKCRGAEVPGAGGILGQEGAEVRGLVG